MVAIEPEKLILTRRFPRQLTFDCHVPPSTPFDVAIGNLATEAGAPPVLSLRTVKSDVVCGIPEGKAEQLDKDEPGWKISGTSLTGSLLRRLLTDSPLCSFRQVRRRPSLRRSQGRAGPVLDLLVDDRPNLETTPSRNLYMSCETLDIAS